MTLRDRQKADTRALLLETARRLVAERGADAVSTRDIAAAASVATGTVFAHFPDKTALLEALLHDHVEAALDRAFSTLPTGGVAEELLHVAGTLYAAYDRDPALSRALLGASLFLADPARPLALQLARFQAWVVSRVGQAVAAGEVRPVDPALVFFGFFSLYFSVLVAGLRGELPAEARVPLLRAGLARFLEVS